jgi:hypothetical protein
MSKVNIKNQFNEFINYRSIEILFYNLITIQLLILFILFCIFKRLINFK